MLLPDSDLAPVPVNLATFVPFNTSKSNSKTISLTHKMKKLSDFGWRDDAQ
jgi:hypothetical protein